MKQSDLLEMIDHCIILCEKEKAAGYPGEATQVQVEQYILPELYELKQKLIDRNIPSNRSQRYLLAFGSAFKVWGWSMQDATELYLSLLHLHDAYQDCQILI